MIRAVGAPDGRCATVARVMPDDRCVVRIDATDMEEILDPRPNTCVRTSTPKYEAGERLLVLHRGVCQDAIVERWMGRKEGSRHLIRVLEAGDSETAAGGKQVERDLNEFAHTVQRFRDGEQYESTRSAYCSDIVAEQCHVEDAITGNILRIEDQLIFVSAADVTGTNIGPKWASVRDVRDVVSLLLEPSQSRHKGTHTAQPLLCRAGPGTGKTWMVKQALYTLAARG